MTTLQIMLIIGVVLLVWCIAAALIVIWFMGMSRHAAVDEETFRRDLARERESAKRAAARPRRTSV